MTIPPATLTAMLSTAPFAGHLGLRTASDTPLGKVDHIDAFARAIRGEIEAVTSKGGRIRYLRELPESARPKVDQATEPDKGSTAFASLNIGAYREAVRGPADEYGQAEVIGHVWQLSLCRGKL